MVTLLVWFAVLPLAGTGALKTQFALAPLFVSLVQHLLYGVALAVVYDRLKSY